MQFGTLQIFFLQIKCNNFLPVSKDLKQALCEILEMLPLKVKPDCLDSLKNLFIIWNEDFTT